MLKIALLTAPLLLALPATLLVDDEPEAAPAEFATCGGKPSVFAMTSAEAHTYQRQNLEHVKLGMTQVREHVAELPEERRAELREATGYAVENCPYTRATIELVQLMRDSAHEAQAGEAQTTGCRVPNAPLTLLVSTLDEHWALLEDIGAVLPPVEGACQAPPQGRIDALSKTLGNVNARAAALDDATQKRLGASNELAARETANLWDSKPILMDYDKWLAKAEDTASNPTLAAARKSFAQLMRLYLTLRC